jgi:tRNA nucleotidyltransferase/poly(A) polymerase
MFMISFTEENLCKILVEQLSEIKDFEEILSIVKNNSRGKIYLVGGTVSRTLVNAIYGGCQLDQDFDFVVDSLNEKLKIPSGWEVTYHKFGNPTIQKDNIEIDIFPLSDHGYIKKNKLEPTIENYLDGTPFTIQALVFDIKHQKLIGKKGIEALKMKKFEVNNEIEAREVAKRKGVSINERMQQKADTAGFEVIPFE